jgi:hypothetical protein
MSNRNAPQDYLNQAMALSREEVERIFSRMRSKLTHKLNREKIDPVQAVALQLQYEAEQLAEWRQRIADLRENDKRK